MATTPLQLLYSVMWFYEICKYATDVLLPMFFHQWTTAHVSNVSKNNVCNTQLLISNNTGNQNAHTLFCVALSGGHGVQYNNMRG